MRFLHSSTFDISLHRGKYAVQPGELPHRANREVPEVSTLLLEPSVNRLRVGKPIQLSLCCSHAQKLPESRSDCCRKSTKIWTFWGSYYLRLFWRQIQSMLTLSTNSSMPDILMPWGEPSAVSATSYLLHIKYSARKHSLIFLRRERSIDVQESPPEAKQPFVSRILCWYLSLSSRKYCAKMTVRPVMEFSKSLSNKFSNLFIGQTYTTSWRSESLSREIAPKKR